MSTYKVADGHDIALVSLNDVSPQPKSEGIKATRRTFGGDGTIYDEGKYVELEFNMVPDVTSYQAILTAFGIKTATTNDVTVYVRDETFTFVRMNGTAIRPRPGEDVRWSDFFPRDVIILVKNLTASA